MTKNFLELVIARVDDAEIVGMAQEMLDTMAKKNAERNAKVAAKRNEVNEPLKEKILELVNDKPLVASEIAGACEISTQKASALCKSLVNEGKLTSCEVKSKNGKVKCFSKVEA